jgi:HPt (histidine-containing phosphotransfer) domain-containing protein
MRRTLILIALAVLPASALALKMDRTQFIDYAAQQHCLNQKLWDQPDKLERELEKLEKKFGIREKDLDALDDLTAKYNADSEVQAAVEEKVRTLCP